MAAKTNQLGVRLDDGQIERLEEIAAEYHHTPTGLIRLSVDQLIRAYDHSGHLPPLSDHATDKQKVSVAIGKGGER